MTGILQELTHSLIAFKVRTGSMGPRKAGPATPGQASAGARPHSTLGRSRRFTHARRLAHGRRSHEAPTTVRHCRSLLFTSGAGWRPRGGAGVPRDGSRQDRRQQPGRPSGCNRHGAQYGHERSGDGGHQRRRRLHVAVPSPRPVRDGGRTPGVPEAHPVGHGAPGQRDRDHQCRDGCRRRDGSGLGHGGIATARNEQCEPRHRHRRRPRRGTAAPVPQPDGARHAGRRCHLQRPGHLPPPLRQRRARRLVDERRPEPQQRVPARRRAQQRQPGREQHRLRPAGRSRAGIQGLDQLVRRAVRAHRRRRRQHVAQVRHEQLPRRRLLLPAAQGSGGQLVPPQLAQPAQDRPVHRPVPASASTVQSGRTRRSSCLPPRSTGKARRPR